MNGNACLRRALPLALAAAGLLPLAHAQAQPAPAAAPAPQFHTADIARFWAAVDSAGGLDDRARLAEALERHYLRPASPGLRDMARLRFQTAERLAAAVHTYRGYYASIRRTSLGIGTQLQALPAYLARFQALYPAARLPDTYLVIAHLGTGGTIAPSGLLIGTELYCRSDSADLGGLTDWHRAVLARPEGLPLIVVHELVHANQRSQGNTLLEQSIHEGAADFVTELVCGAHINQGMHAWALAHEDSLWQAFQAQMHGRRYDDWLYNGTRARNAPADLGYFVGYRICQAYYLRQRDKAKALAHILQVRNYRALLRASGYRGAPPAAPN